MVEQLIRNQQVAGSIPAGGFCYFRQLRAWFLWPAAVCYHFATIRVVVEPGNDHRKTRDIDHDKRGKARDPGTALQAKRSVAGK
jgi:hypothetical protein